MGVSRKESRQKASKVKNRKVGIKKVRLHKDGQNDPSPTRRAGGGEEKVQKNVKPADAHPPPPPRSPMGLSSPIQSLISVAREVSELAKYADQPPMPKLGIEKFDVMIGVTSSGFKKGSVWHWGFASPSG